MTILTLPQWLREEPKEACFGGGHRLECIKESTLCLYVLSGSFCGTFVGNGSELLPCEIMFTFLSGILLLHSYVLDLLFSYKTNFLLQKIATDCNNLTPLKKCQVLNEGSILVYLYSNRCCCAEREQVHSQAEASINVGYPVLV